MKRCLLLPLFVAILAGCGAESRQGLSGYAEAEYVRVAAPLAGSLLTLSVQRGEPVEAGAPLFVLEQDSERAARQEAQARLAAAEARLADLGKGKRQPELAAVQAQYAQARAAQALSTANLARQRQLVGRGFVSAATLDALQGAERADRARTAELAAQVAVAKLAARPDALDAAQQEVSAAREALAQVAWRVAQKSQMAPAAGLVQDTLYRPGEWVAAGAPVVSILPPQNIKLRFFVPESELGRIALGQRVTASCDGCAAPVPAKVSFIAAEAEYTPPVIYSRENRAKLVFMVEARPAPEDAARLHPGQPVEVHLEPSGDEAR
jgi:HlyD family secretion protein